MKAIRLFIVILYAGSIAIHAANQATPVGQSTGGQSTGAARHSSSSGAGKTIAAVAATAAVAALIAGVVVAYKKWEKWKIENAPSGDLDMSPKVIAAFQKGIKASAEGIEGGDPKDALKANIGAFLDTLKAEKPSPEFQPEVELDSLFQVGKGLGFDANTVKNLVHMVAREKEVDLGKKKVQVGDKTSTVAELLEKTTEREKEATVSAQRDRTDQPVRRQRDEVPFDIKRTVEADIAAAEAEVVSPRVSDESAPPLLSEAEEEWKEYLARSERTGSRRHAGGTARDEEPGLADDAAYTAIVAQAGEGYSAPQIVESALATPTPAAGEKISPVLQKAPGDSGSSYGQSAAVRAAKRVQQERREADERRAAAEREAVQDEDYWRE